MLKQPVLRWLGLGRKEVGLWNALAYKCSPGCAFMQVTDPGLLAFDDSHLRRAVCVFGSVLLGASKRGVQAG